MLSENPCHNKHKYTKKVVEALCMWVSSILLLTHFSSHVAVLAVQVVPVHRRPEGRGRSQTGHAPRLKDLVVKWCWERVRDVCVMRGRVGREGWVGCVGGGCLVGGRWWVRRRGRGHLSNHFGCLARGWHHQAYTGLAWCYLSTKIGFQLLKEIHFVTSFFFTLRTVPDSWWIMQP